MRVGILQFAVEAGRRSANHAAVCRLVEKAMRSATAPDVLVLPELWSTGYALEQADRLASPFGNSDAAFLGSLSREFGVAFAGGSVLASVPASVPVGAAEPPRSYYFNRSQVIAKDGSCIAAYDKIHLFRPMGEDRFLCRGGSPVWFSLGGIRCSSVVCYDIRFCELTRRLAAGGAELLFVAAEWPSARISQWEILLRARAVENQMYVAACNRCGASGGETFGGSSMIIAPDGTVLAHAGDGEAVIMADIDPAFVRSTRDALPVFSDRVPDLY